MPDTLTAREERLFADYDVPILSGPEYPNDTVTGPVGRAPRPQPAPTGAMVALVPTDEDATRLAVEGGETADELHTTLSYLGKAANIPAEVRDRIVAAVQAAVKDAIRPDFDGHVEADAFAVSVFNPGGDEPCIVLGLSGKELTSIRNIVIDTLRGVDGLDLPKQHDTFIPHITLLYTDDAAQVADLTDRTGPVTFDRIRVAFAGEAVDIPLSAPTAPLSLPGEPAMALADDELLDATDQPLPIRAFTEPYDSLDDEGDDVGARTEARAERTRIRVESKRKWFRIENRSSGTDIYLYGEVGYFGVTAADFTEELRQVKASTINLHINSPGGSVFDGVAIYNALKAHPASINVTVDGLAASAASFIACAGEKVTIMRHAQMMIHDAWSDAYGNADKLRKQADTLERTSATIADIYSRKAGGDADMWRELMKAETWFNAEEAIQFGLADEIGGDVLTAAAPAKATWDLTVFAFAGRDKAPAPAALVPVMASAAEPGEAPADVDDTAPAEEAAAESADQAADQAPVADTDAPTPEQAADTASPTDTPPADSPSPDTAQPVAWALPAWTTTPADPWQSLVAGLTNPHASTPDDATAQEATE